MSKPIIIRDLSDQVVNQLDWLAKQKIISREEYLRQFLTRLTDAPSLVGRSFSYEEVYQLLIKKIDQHNELLLEVKELLNDRTK